MSSVSHLFQGATLYPIRNIDGVAFQLRRLLVREALPEDDHRFIQLEQWGNELRYSLLKCPVERVRVGGRDGLVLPAEYAPRTSLELRNEAGRIYHLDVQDAPYEVRLGEADEFERTLMVSLLERAIGNALFGAPEFWKETSKRYYRQRPENERERRDELFAYRGLEYGIVLLDGTAPHLAVDIKTTYVSRYHLDQYLSDGRRKRALVHHLDTSLPFFTRPTFLRDNGRKKIPCRYAGDTNQNVAEFRFGGGQQSVHEYYRERYRDLDIDPNERAVFVQDGKGKNSIAVPASRLFPVFKSDYREARRCSVKGQLAPYLRIGLINGMLRDLSDIPFGSLTLKVDRRHLKTERTIFTPPRLSYGRDGIYAAFEEGAAVNASNASFDLKVKRFASGKMRRLYDKKPFHNEVLPDAVMFLPDTLSRDDRQNFMEHLMGELERQTGQRLNLVRQEVYPTGFAERTGRSLLQQLRGLKAEGGLHLVLLVMWDGHEPYVYGELKTALEGWPSQFATERTARTLKSSEARNLALATHVEAGVKPWVLTDPLHFDLHLGIDLLHGRVAYHFFYGQGGQQVVSAEGTARRGGHSREALITTDLAQQLVEFVRQAVDEGAPTRSLLIHRDGRWWPSEQKALEQALQTLSSEGVIDKAFRCGVAEIRKSHLPVRLFTVSTRGSRPQLENPLFGSYLVLDQRQAVLNTTGRTSDWQGRTASTLIVRLAVRVGDVAIRETAEDVYRFTHLNYSEPDVEINLPVTIRWNDQKLRRTLRQEQPAAGEDVAADPAFVFDISF